METYISRLRKLSKKPNNIKELNRGLLLNEYLQEVTSKISYGYEFDDNFLNQSILKQNNIFKKGTDLRTETKQFNDFVDLQISKFDLSEFIKHIKAKVINHRSKSTKLKFKQFNYFVDGSKVIIFFRHMLVKELELFNFRIDNSSYLLKEEYIFTKKQ